MNTESFVWVILRFTGLVFLAMFLYNSLDLAMSISNFFNLNFGLVFGGTETAPINSSNLEQTLFEISLINLRDLEQALFQVLFKKIVKYIFIGLIGFYLFFKGARVHQMIMNQIPKCK